MHCLSQFCCFCFKRNAKLKHISSMMTIITDIIPEMSFSKLTNELVICDVCTRTLNEMSVFRNICVRHNQLFTKLVRKFRLDGVDFRDIEVVDLRRGDQMSSLTYKNGHEVDVICVNDTNAWPIEDCVVKTEVLSEDDPLQTDIDRSNELSLRSFSEFMESEIEVNDTVNCNSNIKNEGIDREEDGSGILKEDLSLESFRDNYPRTSSNDGDPIRPVANPTTESYTCHTCQTSFDTLIKFRSHERTHKSKKYSLEERCEICGKYFTNQDYLNTHRLTHTGKKPYKCDMCRKAFHDLRILDRHKLYHLAKNKPKLKAKKNTDQPSIEELHLCKVCGKGFKHIGSLNRHTLTHNEKQFKCEVCGKAFSLKIYLKAHQVNHQEERPYKCDLCDKSFNHSGVLKRHRTTHTGERLWQCDICEKTFAHAGSLSTHLRIHKREGIYKCGMCGKNFAELEKLKEHELVHGT